MDWLTKASTVGEKFALMGLAVVLFVVVMGASLFVTRLRAARSVA